MELAAAEEREDVFEERQKEIREMVLYGLEQAKMGHKQDFNEVCDRLEKKYRDAKIQN